LLEQGKGGGQWGGKGEGEQWSPIEPRRALQNGRGGDQWGSGRALLEGKGGDQWGSGRALLEGKGGGQWGGKGGDQWSDSNGYGGDQWGADVVENGGGPQGGVGELECSYCRRFSAQMHIDQLDGSIYCDACWSETGHASTPAETPKSPEKGGLARGLSFLI
jgi:hypothetical protein